MPTKTKSNKAYITPELLTWARSRAGLTSAETAKRVNVPEAKLSAWELGEALPTLRQAETLAQKLYVPFGYLFLSSVPNTEIELPDLRTVQGNPVAEPSIEFEDVLNDALRKQEWFKEYLQYEEVEPPSFVSRFSMDAPVKEVAADLGKTLGIAQKIRPKSANWESFLRYLTGEAEQLGVLVLRSGIVGNNTRRPLNVAEFRGFVLSDPLAPLIFLNGGDARSAQIFTLMHELAHLWIGVSGISNPDYQKGVEHHSNTVERFCDKVAAEALVPEQDFKAAWQENRSAEKNCQSVAEHFKVSRVVALRRAYTLNKINRDEFLDYYSSISSINRVGRQGGGDFRRSLLARNSPTFTTALVESVLSGRTDEREATRLLSVKIPTFDRLVKRMTGVGGA